MAVSEEQATKEKQGRFVFIDGLRGIAALSVAGYHFYQSGPIHTSLSQIIPAPVGILLAHGWLGVDVFFVISGFVIAYSLRNTQITIDTLSNFTLRRILRLSPPYWMTILLALAIKYVSNLVLSDRTAQLPSGNTVIAHIFYLQNLLGMDDIVPVFWTLCLEIQFYFVFIILLGFCQNLMRIKINILTFVAPFLLLSFSLGSLILKTNLQESAQTFFYPSWYIFFMGVMVWWVLDKKIHPACYWINLALNTVILFMTWDIQLFVAVLTGLSIYVAATKGQLEHWLKYDWQQYLGKVSYSFYLIHIPIGMSLINIGYRLSKNFSLISLFWFLLAFVCSIIAAHLMYVFVEKPSLRLGQKLKFKTS